MNSDQIRAATNGMLARAFVEYLAARIGLKFYGEAVNLALGILDVVASASPEGGQVPAEAKQSIDAALAGAEAIRSKLTSRLVITSVMPRG